MIDVTTAPPADEEVSYVGLWLDDLQAGESYMDDRWAPFVRCVLSWVGQEPEWRRHPRPLFGGTSFNHAPSRRKFGRVNVEGIFVEVPQPLAARVVEALQTSLPAMRGLLEIEQLDARGLMPHSLETNAWLVGDVCVHLVYAEVSGLHDDVGLRIAYPQGKEADRVRYSSRSDVEAILTEIVARGVNEPKRNTVERSGAPVPTDILVVRTEQDLWDGQPVVAASLALFDLEQAPSDFEEHLIAVVSRRLAQKAYKSELVLWSWIGETAHSRKTYYAALTTHGQRRVHDLAPLVKDIEPLFLEVGEGRLRADARPLLRWRPNEGLTRFWTATPPPDTTLTTGKHTVPLRHRLVHVVRRAAGEVLDFRVDTLALLHFRNQDSFECRFAPRFNVIIGDNARGKTTLLDAMAALLRVVENPEDRGESLRDDDVTEHLFVHDTVFPERQYPAKISATIHLEGREARLEALTRDAQGVSRSGELSAWMRRLNESVRRGVPVDLPLVVYYGIGRAHQPTEHAALDVTAPRSRLSGYAGALDGRLDPLPFQRWFKTMELAALQEQRTIVLLEVIREAVRQCIEGCETVQHMVSRDEIVLRFADGRVEPFRRLSDGYRLTLAMVADIAWRCVTLNPHLGPAATRETSGVVLIDELDLNLHPRWQRSIVGDLRRAFPRLQFIVTTHSPFIVQNMKADEVQNLDQDPDVKMDYQASSIEDIAEEAMGIEGVQRSQRFQDMERAAEEYYRLLETKPADDEEARRLKARLDELMLPYADNPAYVAFLRVRRVAKGLA